MGARVSCILFVGFPRFVEGEGLAGMDTDTVRDVASFDPELLQLPELSHLALKERPKMAEELYFQWLSLPETGKLVRILSLFVLCQSMKICLFVSSVRSGGRFISA